MKIGLLGGTFDPIHRGHVEVARAALSAGIDRVVLIPARKPPHKDRGDIVDPYHRFALAALATVGLDRMTVSAVEVSREGPSYTIDTVRHFSAGDDLISLIMGTDSLAEVATWRRGRELLEIAGVIAFPRRPFEGESWKERLPDWVASRLGSSIRILDMEPCDVSSTQVRQHLARGESIADLVPAAVEEYISKNGLYGGNEPSNR